FALAPLYEQTVVINDQAEMVEVQAVTGGYFEGLGVQPMLGRAINDSDDLAGSQPVALISHRFWQERFGSSNDVVGQQIKIATPTSTIIGVTPQDFTGSLQVGDNPAITVPVAFEPLILGEHSARARGEKHQEIWWLHLMGRLKPGATSAQAGDSLNGSFQGMAPELMPPPR